MTQHPTPTSPSLSGLPLELRIQILEELHWKDVLRIRKTCKALHEASRTRSIWLKLCHPYLTPTVTAPSIIHLERPIELYTSEELEFLLLRLEGAELGRRTDDKCLSRVREVATTKTRIPECTRLMEGGRWLLGVLDTGSVTYLDLDASPITESILIPDQHPSLNIMMWTHMAVDVDKDSAFLAFHLALSFCTPETVTYPTQHCIQIWNVVLLRDAQQCGIGLAAERLASFPQEPLIGSVQSLSLYGPYIALSVFCRELEYPGRIFVIDWLQANGDTTDYRRRLVNPYKGWFSPSELYLLPGNRLLTVRSNRLMILDYLNVEETSTLPPKRGDKVTATTLWCAVDNTLQETSVSGPFFCLGSTRFTFRSDTSIRGLVINDICNGQSGEEIAWLANLWSCPSDLDSITVLVSRVLCSYGKAAVIASLPHIYLLGYSWPNYDTRNHSQPSSVYLEKEWFLQDGRHLKPLLDEASGRVVVPATFRTCHHIVWDYSPLYRDST